VMNPSAPHSPRHSRWDDPAELLCWIDQALAGDQNAWSRLYQHYRPSILYMLGRQSHFAPQFAMPCREDVIGDTWLTMHRGSLKRFNRTGKFLPYLRTVLRGEAADHVPPCVRQERMTRAGKVDELDMLPDSVTDEVELLAAREELKELLQFLRERLDEMDTYIFSLRFVDGLESKEIAMRTHLTRRQVDDRLERMRKEVAAWRQRWGAQREREQLV